MHNTALSSITGHSQSCVVLECPIQPPSKVLYSTIAGQQWPYMWRLLLSISLICPVLVSWLIATSKTYLLETEVGLKTSFTCLKCITKKNMTFNFRQYKPSKSKLPSVRSASVMVATSGSSCKFWVDMEVGRLAAFGFGAPGCCSGRPSSTRDNILSRPSRMSLRSSGIILASCRNDAVRAGLWQNIYNIYT